jgi:hypothetical protein
MTLAGAATAVGLAVVNERGRPQRGALTPAFVEASPQHSSVLAQDVRSQPGLQTLPDFLLRRLGIATLIGAAVLLFAGMVPAVTALASNLRSSPSIAAAYGPPAEMRAAAGVSGNWEQSHVMAAPSAGDLGVALLAGIDEQRRWDNLALMLRTADQQKADQAAAAAAAAPARARAAGVPGTLNAPSGIGVGTVMPARITIYGCTGPGGGFCGGMASGMKVFEGAAACSSNLPMGTRLRIEGDPTGRIYECLDRGALPATWIDVYFENTSEGIAWASNLGGTTANIEIVN